MEQQVSIDVDRHRLAGVLHIPDTKVKEKIPVVLICHGFIGSKVGQHRIFVHAARRLCQAGFAVMRFDYAGCGESTGEYYQTTVDDQVTQTQRVLDSLASVPSLDSSQVILLGHSLGGGIAAVVAGIDQRIGRLILWSPVGVPQEDVCGILGDALFNRCLHEETAVFQGFVLGKNFLLSLATLRPVDTVAAFGGDVLILHGENDVETPVSNTLLYNDILTQRQQGNHQIILISDANHTYDSPVWEQQVIDHSLAWLIGR